MKQLCYKSIFAALLLFAGTLAAEQKTKISAEDIFEITYRDISDAKKPSKYQSLIEIQKAVFLSQLDDDTVYIELKVHNKSAQDILIFGKDVSAGVSGGKALGERGFARGCPRHLDIFSPHFSRDFPTVAKAGGDVVFTLLLDQVKEWDQFDIVISFFDLKESIRLTKKKCLSNIFIQK